MPRLRLARRLAGCVWQLLCGAWLCAFVFPGLDEARRMRHVGAWSARMLAALGVDCRCAGEPHAAPLLLAANHVSWLDILVLNALRPARFVAKHDVRGWPLLGWLVACGGTLFIERERKRDALRVVHRVAQALRDGQLVAVFPEGTTGDGHALLPFHANLLQAAISVGTPIQPVALRYSDARAEVSAAAAYVGDTSLMTSVTAVLRAERLRAHVTLLPVLAVRPDAARRAVAAELRARIARALDDGPRRHPPPAGGACG